MAHLGMAIGLFRGTQSRIAIIGGLISLGIADSLSDAFGIHISEQSDTKKGLKETWITALSTLFGRLLFSGLFIAPFIFFSLNVSMIIDIVWGVFALIFLSVYIARERKVPAYKMILKNLGITSVIIITVYYTGDIVSVLF